MFFIDIFNSLSLRSKLNQTCFPAAVYAAFSCIHIILCLIFIIAKFIHTQIAQLNQCFRILAFAADYKIGSGGCRDIRLRRPFSHTVRNLCGYNTCFRICFNRINNRHHSSPAGCKINTASSGSHILGNLIIIHCTKVLCQGAVCIHLLKICKPCFHFLCQGTAPYYLAVFFNKSKLPVPITGSCTIAFKESLDS